MLYIFVLQELEPTQLQLQHGRLLEKLGYGPRTWHAVHANVKHTTSSDGGCSAPCKPQMAAAEDTTLKQASPDVSPSSVATDDPSDAGSDLNRQRIAYENPEGNPTQENSPQQPSLESNESELSQDTCKTEPTCDNPQMKPPVEDDGYDDIDDP